MEGWEQVSQLCLEDLQRSLDEVLVPCEYCLEVEMILMLKESAGGCFVDCWVGMMMMMWWMKLLAILMIAELTLPQIQVWRCSIYFYSCSEVVPTLYEDCWRRQVSPSHSPRSWTVLPDCRDDCPSRRCWGCSGWWRR